MKEETSGQNSDGKTEPKKKKDRITKMAWDYYMTNREITKEYDAEYERQKAAGENKGRKWTGTEKLYMAAIVIGLVLIAIKYLVF